MQNKKKLKSHKEIRENKDFCNIVMLFEDTKILDFNQYCKSDKVKFIIRQMLNLQSQRLMDIKIILKNYQ